MRITSIVITHGWTYVVTLACTALAIVRAGGTEAVVHWFSSRQPTTVDAARMRTLLNGAAAFGVAGALLWGVTAVLHALQPGCFDEVSALLATAAAVIATIAFLPICLQAWHSGWPR